MLAGKIRKPRFASKQPRQIIKRRAHRRASGDGDEPCRDDAQSHRPAHGAYLSGGAGADHRAGAGAAIERGQEGLT